MACHIFFFFSFLFFSQHQKGNKTSSDYGRQHSEESGHDQHGAVHEGLLPEWDKAHPIDIVAYSLGASTARYLQHLLILEAFADSQGNTIPTNGDWIRSITVQGCNNGSHAVHAVGLGLDSLQPRRFTILWFIFAALYLCHWIFGNSVFPMSVVHWKWYFTLLQFHP